MSKKPTEGPTLAEIMADFEEQFPSIAALPDDHPAYALIGRVAAAWANLEHKLDRIIWLLAGGSDQTIACITGQLMGAQPRVSAIVSLLKLRIKDRKKAPLANELVDQFVNLKNRLYESNDRRNRLVHDAWYIKLKSQTTAQFRSMPFKDPHFGVQDVSEDYIKDTLAKIARRTKTVDDLSDSVESALESWHEKLPKPRPAWTGRTGPLSESYKDK